MLPCPCHVPCHLHAQVLLEVRSRRAMLAAMLQQRLHPAPCGGCQARAYAADACHVLASSDTCPAASTSFNMCFLQGLPRARPPCATASISVFMMTQQSSCCPRCGCSSCQAHAQVSSCWHLHAKAPSGTACMSRACQHWTMAIRKAHHTAAMAWGVQLPYCHTACGGLLLVHCVSTSCGT